jgi:DNA-binding transcriptional LysR family regulator
VVASPAYVAHRGAPHSLDDLVRHSAIRDTNMRGDGAWPLTEHGVARRIPVTGHYLVNSARTGRDLAVGGEGIALCPDYVVRDDLASGLLLHVLPDSTGPVLDIHAVHLAQRRLARRTRALMDFMARDRFEGFLGPS